MKQIKTWVGIERKIGTKISAGGTKLKPIVAGGSHRSVGLLGICSDQKFKDGGR